MPPYAMMQMMEAPVTVPLVTFATSAGMEALRSTNAKSSRR